MEAVPFDSGRWAWDAAEPTRTENLGRECIRVESSGGTVSDVELEDGAIELELAVGAERGFHGVTWRVRDDENFESFFVRPHQVGNPDAVQYTPVFNGISSWQLYHGDGFWAPIAFPIDSWFTIRVVFSGDRAEVYLGDLEPSLVIRELKGPVVPGRFGLFGAGPPIHIARFAYATDATPLAAIAPDPPLDGIVPAWWVSDAFAESEIAHAELSERRSWTRLASEPTGLADLSRVNGVRDGRNAVLARATIRSTQAQTKRLDFGFSDRAVVFLNGRPLYHGDDTYRFRDYRFLGSIGYWDALELPLEEGDNELVFAVAEDLGGWGVQARFPDPDGLELDTRPG